MFQPVISSKVSERLFTLKIVVLSLTLNRIEPLTVQAEITLSCCLMEDSFWKVAFVRSSKKGYLILATLAAPLLVLLAELLESLGANSFLLRKTRFRQYLEKNRAMIGLWLSGLPGRMWAVSKRVSQSGTWLISPLVLAPSRMG